MSWSRARLGEVTNILSGTTPSSATSSYWGGDNIWVTPTDLGKLTSHRISESARRITDAGVRSCNLPLVPATAIVMSSRAPIGHLAIADCELRTNQGCKSFVCSDQLDSEFTFYMLRHRMSDIQALGSGATFVEVSKGALETFEVSFPEICEQRHIAARLRAQLLVVEDARQAAQTHAAEVSALRDALYREAFAGIVPVAVPPEFASAPTGWHWAKLGDIARLESGHTPSRSRPDWWGGEVSWLSLTEIRALDGRWVESTQLRTNDAGIANSAARVLPRGTVCFSRTASVGFVVIMDKPMATSQDFANWVCGPDLDPEFLMHALIRSRRELRAIATGATHKTIYMPALRSFHLCLPERPEQERIVASLKQQLEAIEAMRCGAKQRLAEIERLPARLLDAAFNPSQGLDHD